MKRSLFLLAALLVAGGTIGPSISFTSPTTGSGEEPESGAKDVRTSAVVDEVNDVSSPPTTPASEPRITEKNNRCGPSRCGRVDSTDGTRACSAAALVTRLPACDGNDGIPVGKGCAAAEFAVHWYADGNSGELPFPTSGVSRAAAIMPERPAADTAIQFARGYEEQAASDASNVRFANLDEQKAQQSLEDALEIADEGSPYEELTDTERTAVDMAHAAVFQCDPYPSATKCASCHPGHYREWSVSPHAYAQLSPVFNAMSSKLITLNNGTLGDFCIRCHTPVGMALGEPMIMSNMDRHPASREGVTCVVCHRVNKAWGKGAGRVYLVPAGLNGPIYGTLGNAILEEVLDSPEKYGVLKTDPTSDQVGREIHSLAVPFFQLHTPGFCGACHDVFAPNGFRLEDAFSEYKTSPAALVKHQTCQDCHMGEVAGVPGGYRVAPIAKVGNVETPPRKRTNHMIAGPDHSIIHPGLFPHNVDAIKEEHDAYAGAGAKIPGLATMREWLEFDYEAGWGSPEFERSPAATELNENGPAPWNDPGTRFRGRQIIGDQLALLDEYTERRRQILASGYRLGDIEYDRGLRDGLHFRVLVYNGTDGHGVPTGFDAERILFLRTIVWDANGTIVFVSGDLDPNGDVRDSHSVYVHNGELPIDRQLFTLQTRFIVRNIRGGEREQVLNVPFSLDPLPYVRPATRPFTILGRPIGARKHKKNLDGRGGQRYARYFVKESQLTGCSPYTASVQIVSGMVPINLVHEISSAGFDYQMSAQEIAEGIVSGHLVLHERRAVLR